MKTAKTAREKLADDPFFENKKRDAARKAAKLIVRFREDVYRVPAIGRLYERIHRASTQIDIQQSWRKLLCSTLSRKP